MQKVEAQLSGFGSFFCFLFLIFAMAFTGQTSFAAGELGSISGIVRSAAYSPIGGATVTLSGPVNLSTTSAPNGAFSFKGLKPGTYYVVASAKGYERVSSSQFPVSAGVDTSLGVVLQALSNTQIATIGRITVAGHAQLDTRAAPTVILGNDAFTKSGDTQIENLLEKIPGVTLDVGYSGQTPGSPTYLSIRGAGSAGTAYENVVLEDGEPLRTGGYGLDLSSLTPAIYQNVEVVKGIGGTTVHGADAIGGTVNLVTRDPTRTEGGQFLGTLAGWGTSDFNIVQSNTIGKVGYLFDYHARNTDGYNPPGQKFDFVPNSWGFPGGGPTSYDAQNAIGILAVPQETQKLKNFLGKLRIGFSNSTSASLTYQTTTDFDDYSALAGDATLVVVNGKQYATDPLGNQYTFSFPGVFTSDLRPKYALEFHTQLLGGSLIARSYSRLNVNIFDATGVPAANCCFWDTTRDKLAGESLSFTRLFGKHAIQLSSHVDSDRYHISYQYGGPSYGQYAALYDSTQESSQVERSYFIRDDFQSNAKLGFSVAGYYSLVDTLNLRRFDPRGSIIYRPGSSDVLRLSLGSGFSNPPATDRTTPLSNTYAYAYPGFCPTSEPLCAAFTGNINLREEKASGGDITYQRTWANGGSLNLDFYRTNMQGHIFLGYVPAPAGLVFSPFSQSPNQPILYYYTYVNLAHFTYQGIEADANIPFAPHFSFNPVFDVQSAFTYALNALDQKNNLYLVNNQQFLNVPLHKPTATLNYTNYPGGSSAYLQWVHWDHNNEFRRPPFDQWNAGFEVRLRGAEKLHVAWTNITNSNYNTYPFYNYYDPNYPYYQGTGLALRPTNVEPYSGYGGVPYYYPANSSAPHNLTITWETRWGALASQR